MAFAFASVIWGYHAALGCRPVAASPRACCALNARFDALVSERRVRDALCQKQGCVAGQRGPSGWLAEAGRSLGQPRARSETIESLWSASWPKPKRPLLAIGDAVDVMEAESLELLAGRVSALLDAACAVSSASAAELSSAEAAVELQSRQQDELLAVYTVLARRGELRGFGSVASTGLLPLSLDRRTVTPEDQLRVTGLPTSAFAPPGAASVSEVAAGTVFGLVLSTLSSGLGLDGRWVFGAAAGALVADQLLLGGVTAELASRAVRPGYGKTVREHEAGHL